MIDNDMAHQKLVTNSWPQKNYNGFWYSGDVMVYGKKPPSEGLSIFGKIEMRVHCAQHMLNFLKSKLCTLIILSCVQDIPPRHLILRV